MSNYKKSLVIIFVFFVLTSIPPKLLAHPAWYYGPRAVLEVIPSVIRLGDAVVLDGSGSYGRSGTIVEYEWDWEYNGTFSENSTTYPPDSNATCSDYTLGKHIAALRVTDTGDKTNIDTCIVTVVDIRNLRTDKWYGSIQPAIDEAETGDVIEVSEGLYKENIDFSGRDITLQSTDPNDWEIVNSTIIIASDPNKAVVTLDYSKDANTECPFCESSSMIAGFMITGGLHGIECNDTSSVIRNCIITGNGKKNGFGGGIHNCNSAVPLITNCFIVDNDANYGGGICNIDSDAMIRNCVISGNTADRDGGGIYNKYCSPIIYNCTFTDNDADNGGGMYNSLFSSPTVTNSIFWDNNSIDLGNEIFNAVSAEPDLSYCDIKDSNGSGHSWRDAIGHDGGGNLDIDPRFDIDACFVVVPEVPNITNAVSHWNFDESSSNTVYDSVGGYNGTIYGTSRVLGYINGGLDFDGVSDYVSAPAGAGSDFYFGGSNFSIAAWFKTSATTTGTIFGIPGAEPSLYDYVRLDVFSNGKVQFKYATNDEQTMTSSSSFNDGSWHHVVAVRDGVRTGKLYVDGILVSEDTDNSGYWAGIDLYNLVLYIGRFQAGQSYFNGKIDDVQVYRKALSADEVMQLYLVDRYNKYHLDCNSPCVNAGDPIGDYADQNDIENGPRIRVGRIEIGADEVASVDVNAVYGASFEGYQGFDVNDSISDYDGWGNSGAASTIKNKYFAGSGYYQYLSMSSSSSSSSTIVRDFVGNGIGSRMQHIRFSCIPTKNDYVNVLNNGAEVASVSFGTNGNIYVRDNGTDVDTTKSYTNAAAEARKYFNGQQTGDPNYQYSWIDFEIVFDWDNYTYDVFWSYWDGSSYRREVIKEDAAFNQDYTYFTHVEFKNLYYTDEVDNFELNRMSVSNESSIGGEIGVGKDAYISVPTGDATSPVKGRCELIGSIWYEQLGYYVIEYCATDQDPDNNEANWEVACQGGNMAESDVLGLWDTSALKNGDYFLRIELYNDLGLRHSKKIISKTMSYNGGTLHNEVNVPYPVYTKMQGGTFSYEEKPDIVVDWPGQFPFELKRMYNSNRAKSAVPLSYGWTYNHDIKLYEDCTFNWIVDGNVPAADASGLGIGRIWLMDSGSSALYTGKADPNGRVIYKSALTNDYIIRTSSVNGTTFSVCYTYYGRDGIEMVFDRLDEDGNPFKYNLNYTHPAGEGAVDWSVFVGATEKRDRFGNALNYDWYYHEQQNIPICVTEITNNRTPAYIKFDILSPEIPLYKKASLFMKEGEPNVMTVSYDWLTPEEWWLPLPEFPSYRVTRSAERVLIWDQNDPLYHEHKEYSLFGNPTYLLTGNPAGCICERGTFIIHNYDSNKRVLERVRENVQCIGLSLYWSDQTWLTEGFTYGYDNMNNLVTTCGYHDGGCNTWGFDPSAHKIVTTVQDSNGAVLSEKTQVGEASPPWIWDINNLFAKCVVEGYFHRPRGGGVVDVSYFYEDTRFPTKPTEIIECFDDDGKVAAGGNRYDRDSRKTTMEYDPFGNLIERRIYIDETHFTATQWEFHPLYDFPIRQTTWQGYCYDSGGDTVPNGKRIETLYIYGDANGVADSEGKFLVQQKVLIDDTDGDVWADTNYTYYDDEVAGLTGLIRSQTDPVKNITFYAYDANGFMSKVWKGAILDANGLPIGTTPPQERYYYNEIGQCLLQADALGAVTENVYNGLGMIEETRKYHDVNAVSRADFNSTVYDDNNFDSIKEYQYYRVPLEKHASHPPEEDGTDPSPFLDEAGYVKETLDTSGVIRRRHDYGFDAASPTVFAYDDNSVMHQSIMLDGKPLNNNYVPGDVERDGGHIVYLANGFAQDFYYDSMNRPIHEIWRENKPVEHLGDSQSYLPLAVKHRQTGYFGDGNKQFEKTYKIICQEDYNASYPRWEWRITKTLEQYSEYEYDHLGRLINQIDHNDANSPVGAPDMLIDPNNRITSFGYDAAGNKIYVIDPNDNVTFTDYDNTNRKIKEYFPLKAQWNPDGTLNRDNAKLRQKIDYFKDGKVQTVTMYDNDGVSILAQKDFTYDKRGRIAQVSEKIDASTDANTYYYYKDYSDNQLLQLLGPADDKNYHIQIEDAEHQSTYIKLNEFGMTKKILYPSGNYEETKYTNEVYDVNGIKLFTYILPYQKTVWDANGVERQIEYEYDQYGKVKKILYPDDGYLEYEYGPRCFGKFGRVERIKDYRNAADRLGDPGTAYQYTYDSFDRITSYNDSNQFLIQTDLRATDNQRYSVKVIKIGDPCELIYDVNYAYNLLGQMRQVYDPCILDVNIASFQYDDNGNRKQLKYWLSGEINDTNYCLNYTYDIKNNLIGIVAANKAGDPNYTFEASDATDIDGFGRLKHAAETITYPPDANGNRGHTSNFIYNMQSSLINAHITDVNDSEWWLFHFYKKDGNIYVRYAGNDLPSMYPKVYSYDTTPGGSFYDSDVMTQAGSDNLTWDKNGRLVETPTIDFEYNWDGKLRSATIGGNSIALKYDPSGNRILKDSTINGNSRYIVDISGGLPVILLEIDPANMSVKKGYIYSNGQILAGYDGDSAARHFYVHDRLGSIRVVLDSNGTVRNSYTYNPFGEIFTTETTENAENNFKFTGQWYDSEIGQYYLRARMYDPVLMRLTSYDPISGKYESPLSLHKYLYCENNPINLVDLNGQWSEGVHNSLIDEAFADLPTEYLEQMHEGSAYDDMVQFQLPGFAYMHAMTDATTGQSVEDAKKQMWQFATGKYAEYRKNLEQGNTLYAYNCLGQALHPIMDSTAPAHNWKPWGGKDYEIVSHRGDLRISLKKSKETQLLMLTNMRTLEMLYESSN